MKIALIILTICLNTVFLKAQDSLTIETKHNPIVVKTNLLTPLFTHGAELSVEFPITKKITIQVAGNIYSYTAISFWKDAQSLIIESRYYIGKKHSTFDGLYLGPYLRYKSSHIVDEYTSWNLFGSGSNTYHNIYDTKSINYGLTGGWEFIFKSGITLNVLMGFGTGINLSTIVIVEDDTQNRNDLINTFNVPHGRFGICLGYNFF